MFSFFQDTTPRVEMDDTQIIEVIVEKETEPEKSTDKEVSATHSSVPSPTTMTSSSPDVVVEPAKTWEQIHAEYCRQNACLSASLQQVFQSMYPNSNEDIDLPWPWPTQKHSLTDLSEFSAVSQSSSSTSPATKTTSSSSWLSWSMGWTGSSKTSEAEDEDGLVAWGQPIYSVPLLQDCLTWMQEYQMKTRMKSEGTAETAVGYSPQQGLCVLLESEWHTWAVQATQSQLPTTLSRKDSQALLDVLLTQQSPSTMSIQKQVSPSGKSLLIMVSACSKDQDPIQSSRMSELGVTLYELHSVASTLQQQMKEWSHQLEVANQTWKQEGSSDRATITPQRRMAYAKAKFLQRQVDTTVSKLLQVEQLEVTLKAAHSNAQLLPVLQEGSSLLESFRKETTLEHIEEMQEKWREQQEHEQDMQSALQQTTGSAISSTDDELLAELTQLMEATSLETDAPAPNSTVAVTATTIPVETLPIMPDVPTTTPTTTTTTTAVVDSRKGEVDVTTTTVPAPTLV
eukprot:Nitzschia sp. Nitz4//scaffold28_size193895//80223//81761//NITZ4_001653-RA/size193895-processed-gene-0.262-mRNA-1//-1//CDS//3329545946//4267//frame0